MNIQKNIFLATHPVLNNLTRAMSVFSSVNRAVMSALNTINIAMIALNTNSSGVAQANADLAQAQREYNDAVKKFGPDSKQAIEAMDKLRVAEVRLAEETQNRANQINSALLAIVTGVSGVVTSIVLTLPRILPFLGGLFSSLSGIAGLFKGGLGTQGLAAFFSQFISLIPGAIAAQEAFGNAMRVFFRETLPSLTISGIAMVTNFMNSAGKVLVDGINSVVSGIVNAINVLISVYNRVASRLKIGKIEPIRFTPISFTPVGQPPTSTFPGGTSPQTNPYEFITPRTSGGGGGSTIVNNVTVQGSILTENDIKKVFDKWLKNDLKTVGFG